MTATTAHEISEWDELVDRGSAMAEMQQDYIDRYRKVPIGPSVTAVFENAQTLAFRVREVQRLRRSEAPATVQRMLGWYSNLMPSCERLCAAVRVGRPGRRTTSGLQALGDRIADGRILLQLGSRTIVGEVLPAHNGDRVLGPAFWVSFTLDAPAREALTDPSIPVTLAVDAQDYDWSSELISAEIRQSLYDDLTRHL